MESKTFSVQLPKLVDIVSKYETRSFAEEVDLLEEEGENANWLFTALNSDLTLGISNDPHELEERKAVFGTN